MKLEAGYRAPIFGLWQSPEFDTPMIGVVVLGIGWTREGYPVPAFVRLVAEGDDGEQRWVDAFTGDDKPAPWLWAECRWIVPVDVDEPDEDCGCNYDPELN